MAIGPTARQGSVLLLDGGTGSELRRRGVELSAQCWSGDANIWHQELLTDIHRDYIAAGVDIVTANTFATTRFVLDSAGLAGRFEDINRSAIAAARGAANETQRTVTVAASLSCFPPGFDSTAYPPADDEYKAYSELTELFADCGTDLLLLEMMQQPAHAMLACRAAAASGLSFWIGLSCRRRPADGRLVAADYPEQSFSELLDCILEFDPAGIAVMHSPADAVGPALEELARRWSGLQGAYAEIPYAQDPASGVSESPGPADYAATATPWLDQGISLVGGCCGTTPAHIAALRRLIDG